MLRRKRSRRPPQFGARRRLKVDSTLHDHEPDKDQEADIGGLSPDDFRRYGHQAVDWIAEYFAHPERYPVLSRARPGEIRDALPLGPPEESESFDLILRDFEDIIIPGMTHWNHPAFFAYFAISSTGPGILGELLSAALNVNVMLWRTSPAASELEDRALDWLRQLLGLPPAFEGVIYDTASVATLVALTAAREATGLDIRALGMAGRPDLPPLRVYCSEQAHSSVEKDAITIGIGQDGVRKIPTDAEYRMDIGALRQAIEEDRAAGLLPFCVVATVGTTATTSIDPVPAIADLCAEHQLWLHVDAVYGGMTAIIPEMRWVLEGCERADSVVFNPHKWLFTPIDLSAFYSRRLEAVRDAFSLVPEYLRTPEDPHVRNYSDYGMQLGRRFRALKLWFVLRSYGRQGLIAHLREHIRLAREFAAWIDEASGWERLAPTPFSTVCFRAHPAGMDEAALEALNETIMTAVNASGEAFLSHARLNGVLTLRLAIGNAQTRHEHVHRTWTLLQEAAASARQQDSAPAET